MTTTEPWTTTVRCANPRCPDYRIERTISFAELGDGVFHVPVTVSALGLSVWSLGCGTCRTQMVVTAP